MIHSLLVSGSSVFAHHPSLQTISAGSLTTLQTPNPQPQDPKVDLNGKLSHEEKRELLVRRPSDLRRFSFGVPCL